ncbi:MAG: hypothetical protein ACKVZJ_14080 [Phycisphaerales bacterium]
MTALSLNTRAEPKPSRPPRPPLTLVGNDETPAEPDSHRVTPRTIDPAAFTDLRRKRSADEVDRLIHLAQWLPASDRALVLSVFQDHRTTIEAGALSSMTPRNVRKRLRAVVARLLDPSFELVVRCRERWPTIRRRVATAVFLHGRTQRDAAAHLQLTLHAVRFETQLIRALATDPIARRATSTEPRP